MITAVEAMRQTAPQRPPAGAGSFCCEGFRMTAHGDGSACTGAVVRKPPVKERAGDGVPTVTQALWRFDRGVDGGRKTRGRGRQEMAVAGGSRARLSRDDDGFPGRLPC